MYAALATKSECRLSALLFHEDDIRRSEPSRAGSSRTSRIVKTPRLPISGLEGALREYAPIPRQMRESELLEGTIENQLVRSRDRSGSDAGGRNGPLQGIA